LTPFLTATVDTNQLEPDYVNSKRCRIQKAALKIDFMGEKLLKTAKLMTALRRSQASA
jgi:hypothetical protein